MLKKKNIAMAMAAVTVATPVASVFAAPSQRGVVDSTQKEEIQAIKDEAFKMFQVKFTENAALLSGNKALAEAKAGSSVYTVAIERAATQADVDTGTATSVGDIIAETYSNYAAFEKAFDAKFTALESGDTLRVKYTEAVHSEAADGQIIDSESVKYAAGDFTAPGTIKGGDVSTGNAETSVTTSATQKIEVEQKADNTFVAKIQISDEDGKERFITVSEGDAKLDLTRPVYRQVNGYYVDATGTPIKKVDNKVIETSISNGVIDGYYKSTAAISGTAKITYDAIVKDEVKKVTLNASELYNVEEQRFTAEGNEIIKELRNLALAGKHTFAYSKTDATITGQDTITITSNKTGNVVAEIKIKNDTKKGEAFAFFTQVTGDLASIVAGTKRPTINTLGSTDRYKTAVDVAKEGWNTITGDGTFKEVVLVSGDDNSLVDGLAATPLAATLNDGTEGAPILLTKKDSIPTEVVEYLQSRGVNKVYIVGGTSAVSETVENTLETRYSMKVERLAGYNRYETSLEVAEEIAKANPNNTVAHIVGGKAEADALSISAAAGNAKQPIVLVPQNGMTSDIKYALKGMNRVNIVGGSSVISEGVAKELVDMGVTTVKRFSGTNRLKTNAAILEEFHQDADEIVFAKSDTKGLVDSLAAGAYAARKDAPIVLATDSLDETQQEALEATKKSAADVTVTKTQVGHGIKGAVAKFIAELNLTAK